jgi:hypothetical protein
MSRPGKYLVVVDGEHYTSVSSFERAPDALSFYMEERKKARDVTFCTIQLDVPQNKPSHSVSL